MYVAGTLVAVIENVKVAVVGVGNNTSALVQGISFYRNTGSLVGIHRPQLAGLGVGDIDFVAAFAISDGRVGTDLHEAILMPPNNFPRLEADLAPSGVTVQRGLVDSTEVERMVRALGDAEVLLLSAKRPAGNGQSLRRGGPHGGRGIHQHNVGRDCPGTVVG